jgi:hypothetical protein
MADDKSNPAIKKQENTEKLIKPEKIEKLEVKEKPEKFEHKEKPEKFEHKEKPEKFEHKEKPEKFESKEKVELLEKLIPEVQKQVVEVQTPLGEGTVEQRLAAVEQVLNSMNHFITAAQRPDLTRGALAAEANPKKPA